MAGNTNGFNVAGNVDMPKPETESKNGTVNTETNISKEYILPKHVKEIKEKVRIIIFFKLNYVIHER